MRRTLAICFLIIVCLPFIGKVGFFTFFQLNRAYIASTFCVNKDQPITMCYGKCFLLRGLQLTEEESKPQSLVSHLRFDISEFVVADFRSFSVSGGAPSAPLLFQDDSLLSEGIPSSVFRPPLV